MGEGEEKITIILARLEEGSGDDEFDSPSSNF